MNHEVKQALAEVDVVLLVIEALRFSAEDSALLKLLPKERPVLLVINKTDKLSDRRLLLPFIQQMAQQHEFAEIVPVSAVKGHSVEHLAGTISRYLPQRPALYGADEITESSERFLAAELIRKLFRLLGDELPYVCAVWSIDSSWMALCARSGLDHCRQGIAERHHRRCQGGRLKDIGTKARIDMEKLFGGKVHLEVWVKVKSGWTENQQFAEDSWAMADARQSAARRAARIRAAQLPVSRNQSRYRSFTQDFGRVALVARAPPAFRVARRAARVSTAAAELGWKIRAAHAAQGRMAGRTAAAQRHRAAVRILFE
jgi:GTP-binding protein Era